ncbi:MAG: hypothetical protein GY906_07880 [bacterium]|nr:hypothetical protein [bacterium]
MPRRPRVFIEGGTLTSTTGLLEGRGSLPKKASLKLETDFERLKGPGQGLEICNVRYLVATLAVERWKVSTKSLADLVGRRADVVTRWVRSGTEIRLTDEQFRERYEALDAAMARAAYER